ncbi:MAG: hypothetical protein SOR89_02090 [Ndongobacter sp.]|nr:hypothetical protein [Ndongobacter sp.]
MTNKEKVSIGTIFGVVSVWFGAHAGGGFASGNQTMSFFVNYGWPAIFTPLLAIAFLTIIYRIIMIICNQHGINNYADFGHKLYAPYNRIIEPFYEICYLGAGMLATSASVAGASAVINQVFGIPYMLCVVVIAILTIFVSMFGVRMIARASTVMVVLIAFSVLVIAVAGLATRGEYILQDISANYAPQGIGPAVWKSITYASFQIFSLMGAYGVATQLKTEKACNKAAILGFVINGGMLLLNALLCLAYREVITGNTLPILTICQSLDSNLLTVLYTVCLFCAFVSTAASVVFGTIARFGKYHEKMKLSQNVWNLLVGIIVILISMGAASFGLTAIVAVGYSYLGVIGIFLVAIPCLIVGSMKIRKYREMHRAIQSQEGE